MNNDNRRKVTFVPRFSIFNKHTEKISFDMFENFDFSSIKNIITLKFIIPAVKATTYLFAKTKDNKLKFKNIKANAEIIFAAKTKDNKLKFINTAIAKVIVFFSSKPVTLKFNTNSNSRIKLFAKGQEKISFKTISNEHFITSALSHVKLKFATFADAVCKFNMTGVGNKLEFKTNISNALEIFHAKSDTKDKLVLNTTGNMGVKLHAATFNNTLAFKTQASAFVYRPTKLGDLYGIPLEDLYDKPLGELYGLELK